MKCTLFPSPISTAYASRIPVFPLPITFCYSFDYMDYVLEVFSSFFLEMKVKKILKNPITIIVLILKNVYTINVTPLFVDVLTNFQCQDKEAVIKCYTCL